MADPLAPLQQLDTEVADADRPDLALVHEPAHLAPGILDGNARFVRPVELVQIDPLHSEPAQRTLDLDPDEGRLGVAHRRLVGIGRVEFEAAFREDERPIRCRDADDGTADHFFRMTEAVDRGRVYPADATRHGMLDGPDRVVIVLRTPSEGPAPAADRPRAKADCRDLEPAGAERARLERQVRFLRGADSSAGGGDNHRASWTPRGREKAQDRTLRRMTRTSAGILLYRRREGVLEVLLVPPGGPFFGKKDLGNWSIPKGEVGPADPDYEQPARREL